MDALLEFYLDPRNNLVEQTITFFQLCLIPIALAIVIGVVVGVLVYRSAALSFVAVNASNLIRAVPVLAALFIFVPIFKIGFLPAAVALTLLGIPPVLLNTYVGLRGVDSAAIEAARGMGMTGWQIMTRVQAPLVLPVLAAGVRTAAVQVVATAPLGGLIGAGGYGDYIIDGVNSLNTTEILAGSILVAALAMLVEIGMSWLERRLTPAGLKAQAA
ncbi:MAG: ABC transporter permease [Chloroflexi bacterium]|nr:ABC transporter permease [Chloroflexota bacterium]MCL5951900.1 ABC transporter permease [Chloroflexota bacterium]